MSVRNPHTGRFVPTKIRLNWKAIREELDSQAWEKSWDGDREERLCFIGTVFNLMPSGKYYMPWACSNVEEWEAEADEEARESLERECDKRGLFLTCSEGDPCDLLVGESRDVEEK